MSALLDRPSAVAPPGLDDFRRRFPAARDYTYLNVASRGITSNAAHAAGIAMLEGHWRIDAGKDVLAPILARCRAGFADLIGGRPTEVALTQNVSQGLNIVAGAVDWRPGDNIVATVELEHANNVYLWQALTARGVELRVVPPTATTEIDTGAMARAIDRRTRVVTASSVSFTPGFRTDLAPIGRAARAHDALFLVDAVQSCGVLTLDVDADAIDAVAVSTSKGLLGLMGFGFLWVREGWIDRLRPAAVARNSIDQKGGHYSEMEGLEFDFAHTAERFEAGNFNYVGAAVAAKSLEELAEVGVSRIEANARDLAERLRQGLERQGFRAQRPADPAAATHIVTVGVRGAGGAYATDDPRLNRLADALVAGGVRFSIRRGLVRFGFHGYNDAADVARVLEIAATV
jgi:selenocysteine lyase/cysteine desulfurase